MRVCRAAHPLLETAPRLVNQSLTLRYVRLEDHVAFGGGGTDLGAVVSCKYSTLLLEYVEAVYNTQKGVGAGTIFVEGCSATIASSAFDGNHNRGLGAGAIYALAGSTVEVSFARFAGNTHEREIPESSDPGVFSASAIVLDSSTMSILGSSFELNVGGDVIRASSSTLDVQHTAFKRNADAAHKVEWDGDVTSAYRDYANSVFQSSGRRRMSETSASGLPGATVSLWSGTVATLSHSLFAANGGHSAGALFIGDAGTSVNIEQVDFMHNQADASDFAAGAIFVTDNATAIAVGGSFDSNAAASQYAAGAIYARQATVVLSDSAFTNNEAFGAMAAGGVLYADESTVSVTRTNSSDNLATGGTELTASSYADALWRVA
eukprot:COSAG04_NODE_81_length_27945_cov_46.142821_11_plen_378_part_00